MRRWLVLACACCASPHTQPVAVTPSPHTQPVAVSPSPPTQSVSDGPSVVFPEKPCGPRFLETPTPDCHECAVNLDGHSLIAHEHGKLAVYARTADGKRGRLVRRFSVPKEIDLDAPVMEYVGRVVSLDRPSGDHEIDLIDDEGHVLGKLRGAIVSIVDRNHIIGLSEDGQHGFLVDLATLHPTATYDDSPWLGEEIMLCKDWSPELVDANAGPGQVAAGQPSVNGALHEAIIRRYIKRNVRKLHDCYKQELLAKPALTGTVVATFTIASDGNVTSSTATGLEVVDACVAAVIGGIEFPKPKDGGIVKVTYPFVFEPLQAP